MIKLPGKKTLYLSLLVLIVAVLGVGTGAAWHYYWKGRVSYPSDIVKRANDLQERIISFDSHVTVPLDFGTEGTEADKDTHRQFDLVKAGRGRMSGVALSILAWPEMWNGPNAPHRPTAGFIEEARHQRETRYRIIQGLVRDFPNQVAIAYTPADLRRIASEGKLAVVVSLLNAYAMGDDLDQLDKWAARGMRLFGFSYVGNNDWADSSRPLPFFNDTRDALGGLSPIGKQAVHRLNDLGVVIDVSQMSSKALDDVAALTRAPLVASHSAPRALVDIPRNLSDKELQVIKATGGVVQVVGFSTYLRPLSQPTLDKLNALRKRFDLAPLPGLENALMPGDSVITIWPEQRFGEYASALYGILEEEPKASLKDYVDAIDYTVKKIGIDHVGISSDFNEGGGVNGWMSVADNRNVTAELIQRGYTDIEIAKLWGENYLRVWEQVHKLAKPAQPTAQPAAHAIDRAVEHASTEHAAVAD
ncbi:pyoverdine-tailoring dipeptidase-like protein PvdM [Pseudomonas chlororaphis]|uniref:pyoverdine-tailoring dipeptidase-like protein PvdM n=1 Tax=Pseudomonas chlororaphis TaxID=587753 RepID=UPI000E0B2FFB|nr:pyoverdine-tailoring dipeptidase-like protein PvdM [Pseudomonas chlororaphis]AZD16963.1 Putative dipeptidase, pyoverdin biosynthesis PvdM [Pseudomonas chlororaphis]WDH45559.1 pyoverdine-tailoring dipeptidase-like protein PvdM [Pseudomonas chlororaphis]WDH57406.1 pyoverdine-tailoring dipeptidase-like protein PvdM [Pseudomonas chlororaphis]WQE16663.1 pyoverdine-tailoring dipeptidase-like protein PvdM [Pseudomonas chlororaphis]